MVGRNLRRLRKDLGIGQVELSEASGVPQPTISDIETGKRDPLQRTLRKLAEALGVPLEEFFHPVVPSHPKGEAPSPESEERRETVYISAASGSASGSTTRILAGLGEHFDAIVAPLRSAGLGEDEAAEIVSQEVRRRVAKHAS